MKKLVSIIIPAYNAEKWIGACIESVISQTWNRKEIIVIDDGSRDETHKIAGSYASRMVLVRSQDNRGAAPARNRGLSLAQGDYIQWLDADDVLAPDKIERQMEVAERERDNKALFSGSWGRFYSSSERAIFKLDQLWEDLEPLEWLLRKLENNVWMPPMVFLVSRRLTEMAGCWNEKLTLDDDGEYFCRVISRSAIIRFIPDARCFKRMTLGLSHGLTLNNCKLDSLAISLFHYIQKVISLEENERTRRACLILLNRWAGNFFPQRLDIFNQMQTVASDLGGRLEYPKLPTKYRWIQKIFGLTIAKKAQFTLAALRYIANKHLERFYLKPVQDYNRRTQ